MRKDTQKVIQGCMFVSFVDTTDFYNRHLFLYPFFLFFFCLFLFCFLLHYTLGLALTDQVTSALLPLHHALIMVCLWSPVATSHGSEVHIACVCWSIIRSQEAHKPSFFCQGTRRRVIWLCIGIFLRRNATSWTFFSVSLLILECWSCIQVNLRMVTKVGSSPLEIFIGWGPFRIRMWNSAAIQSII